MQKLKIDVGFLMNKLSMNIYNITDYLMIKEEVFSKIQIDNMDFSLPYSTMD